MGFEHSNTRTSQQLSQLQLYDGILYIKHSILFFAGGIINDNLLIKVCCFVFFIILWWRRADIYKWWPPLNRKLFGDFFLYFFSSLKQKINA